MLRHALGVVYIVERAAAVLRGAVALQFGKAALIPQLHRQADDGAALPLEHGGDGGGIHTPRHGDGDQAGRRVQRGCWQGIELDRFSHDYLRFYCTGVGEFRRGVQKSNKTTQRRRGAQSLAEKNVYASRQALA